MITKLTLRKTGGGWSIYMSKSILELMEISPETDYVQIDIESETLILKKAY